MSTHTGIKSEVACTRIQWGTDVRPITWNDIEKALQGIFQDGSTSDETVQLDSHDDNLNELFEQVGILFIISNMDGQDSVSIEHNDEIRVVWEGENLTKDYMVVAHIAALEASKRN